MYVKELARPPKYVRFRLFGTRKRRILVVRFDVLEADHRRSFGVHARRMHEAIYIARSLDAAAYFVWYREAPNQAFHRLASTHVHIINTSRLRDGLVLAVWHATSPLIMLRRALYRFTKEPRRKLQFVGKQLARRAKHAASTNTPVRRIEPLLTLAVRLGIEVLGWLEPVQTMGKEVLVIMSRNPVEVYLRPALEQNARAQAQRVGLDPAARIVTLHAREPGWRPQEGEWRSCDIATYRPAVDELVRRGFHVVRTGDPSMTPINWPGVIDLATHQRRTDLLELWCLLHSEFFIGCDSGVTELTKLLGMPTLLVNVKHIQSQYPLRRSDLFLVKRLTGTDSSHVLSLREQLAAKRREYALDGPAQYIDNSPEEILEAVVELLDGQGADAPETPEQAEFHRLATLAYGEDGEEVAKYVGDGRIARFFAERYLESGEPLTTSSQRTDRVP